MTSLSIKLDPGDIAKVRFMLGSLSKSGDSVIKQAVNRTLTGVRTDTTNEVSNVITPTKTAIRKTITVNKMTAKDGNAFVKCKGGPLNLIHYKARPTNKGVTVQVLKSGGRSLVKHAYIAVMKNGSKLVLWRKDKKHVGIAKWDKGNKQKYGKLPIKYRFPVKALSSLAVPDVMGYPKTINEILRLGGARLKKNLNDRLNYELSKANG